ncbi:acireductone synthase [Dactylosporangium aurantiacum]|uniref:Enolase-phosphatase E1 n=1 Tax=Dactylosporangium aurantiacum TaxID=35754 RepID=A0A9Q9IDU9_9ACTN|nr:acireductone synthase [Dactylosporangium aurantiacum]MDG6107073.1 acireductone synthase [Dactylosporangium aurantiacum]UWZ51373.1 acireductone synthase [Dactylosporangium aurantiacum]
MRAVVLDVEGTTSSSDHVHRVLFGHARRRLPQWLAAHHTDPEVAEALATLPVPGTDLAGRVALLRTWMDEDRKETALKTVQGLIWQEGFAAGELTSHVYPDVPPALRAWHADGLTLCVFSSGSVAAQRAWFRHTPHGDLRPYLSHHFDTANAGGKSTVDAYRTIAAALGVPGDGILFLSDSGAELRAARDAGWHAVAVCRDGRAAPPPAIRSFAELEVTARGYRLLDTAAPEAAR